MLTTQPENKNTKKKMVFDLNIVLKFLHEVQKLRYHPPSSTLPALIGASAFALINTPINRTFSESLIVADYCLFLLKNQNINVIQKWEAFCESGCHRKFKSRPAKNKQKKQIKIAFASEHVWLKNHVSDFCQVGLFFCDKHLKFGIANH